jgi:hypothetical protein
MVTGMPIGTMLAKRMARFYNALFYAALPPSLRYLRGHSERLRNDQ